MRSIVARMFEGCGSSRNFASQLVDPDCAAGAPTRAVTMPMASSAPERRLMAAPMWSILVNEGVEFHELIERRADAVAGGGSLRSGTHRAKSGRAELYDSGKGYFSRARQSEHLAKDWACATLRLR